MPGELPIGPGSFDWQGIIIQQGDSVHKVGTDAVLLGSWVPLVIPEANAILDVGTGSGILALMMAKCFQQAYIRAIDVDLEAINLTKLNVQPNAWKERVGVVKENILDPPSDTHRFDLVVCNPPYHEEQILPKEPSRQRAKHINASVKDWVIGLISRMTDDGHLMLVVPSASSKAWIEAANDIGYYNLDQLDVFSFEDDVYPKRTLLHLTRKLAKPSINRMVIYHKDKTYTSSYLHFTGISPTNSRKK